MAKSSHNRMCKTQKAAMPDRITQDERVNFKKHKSVHWLRLQATDDDYVEDG